LPASHNSVCNNDGGLPVNRAQETAHVPQGQSDRDIAELPCSVELCPEAAAGDAVIKPRGYFVDPVTLAEDIDDQRGSTPQPRARGCTASKACREMQRIPERGWAGWNPVRYTAPDLASRTTRP